MTTALSWLLLASLSAPAPAATPAEDSSLTLADLEAYRLAFRPGPAGTATTATFRDLWDRPGAYAGRRVRVEGKVVRLFRQPGMGEFPPLAEAWIVTPAADPSCLVFADGPGAAMPEVGSDVRFVGTFLRRIKYRGGDTPRLAPLIVGPGPPEPKPTPSPAFGLPGSPSDWLMGVGAAAIVSILLARRHLSRPPGRPPAHEPPPEFLDGDASADSDVDEDGGPAHEHR